MLGLDRIELDRRKFLASAGGVFAANLLPWQADALAADGSIFAAAAMDGDGAHFVVLLDGAGAIIDRHRLPSRGHDAVSWRGGEKLAVFARRPGTFAVAFDGRNFKTPQLFATPHGRHFYGHGVYSGDGRLLYATENDYEGERGIVGIYDATDGYRRIGEFTTHGIGPHELLLAGGDATLIVANGGILTHPDFGRAKLNLATMKPSIVFLDAATGDLLEKHELPAEYSRLSTRHMTLDASGKAWIGCQYEGDAGARIPLIASLRRGEELTFADVPETDRASLENYVGSVAANTNGELVVFTSPKGGVAMVLDAATGRLVSTHKLPRVCGAASSGSRDFVLSSEFGRFGGTQHRLAWDNHIARVT